MSLGTAVLLAVWSASYCRSPRQRQTGCARVSTMDFRLSEEQELFRQTVRRLAEEKVAPRATEIDEADEFPWDMHQLFVDNELMGVGYPEDVGGSGGPIEFVLLVEEIS